MNEVQKTPRSFSLYLFGGFISLNLLFCTQIIGVKTLRNEYALLPLSLCIIVSMLKHLMTVVYSKNKFRSPTIQYHMASITFNISVLLLLICCGRYLDLSAQLTEYQTDNRRKEKAGFIEEGDEEYDDLEEQVAKEVAQSRLWVFVMAYMAIVTYCLVIYVFGKVEEEYLITLGQSGEERQSLFSWEGISSAISSWSVICSGGACYNVGTNAMGSVGSSLGAGFAYLSHLILPITIVFIMISIYTLRIHSWAIIGSGAFGGLIIIISSILELHFIILLVGNVILIATSLVASKRKKKKSKKSK
ncbi:unnamed protein product [Moneuplotes crassus]|uniref:Uncharacterized protein n=1 Tax=Euplotes crassus TaxID=5936 RepID=A0AAD1US92_EUPCR|nr:unnamed protein product [Moneuplotes crassus]